MRMCWVEGDGDAMLTLGLLEDTLLNTRLQSLVEQGVEHVVGGGNVVVGLDILLEALAAVVVESAKVVSQWQCGDSLTAARG